MIPFSCPFGLLGARRPDLALDCGGNGWGFKSAAPDFRCWPPGAVLALAAVGYDCAWASPALASASTNMTMRAWLRDGRRARATASTDSGKVWRGDMCDSGGRVLRNCEPAQGFLKARRRESENGNGTHKRTWVAKALEIHRRIQPVHLLQRRKPVDLRQRRRPVGRRCFAGPDVGRNAGDPSVKAANSAAVNAVVAKANVVFICAKEMHDDNYHRFPVAEIRPTDSVIGVTRKAVKAMATRLGVPETEVVHFGLARLAESTLPSYEGWRGGRGRLRDYAAARCRF